jgi:hypothetical protein
MLNVKVSKLHFVDLAGSERQKSTAAEGDRLKEASNINKSLTCLGSVINALVEVSCGKQRHIPYRDSKLTLLLKDSLGGNSKTFMIANISSASTQFPETLSTLKFAQRAKQIKNKASINEESLGNVENMKKEIKRLRDELQTAKQLISTLELDKKTAPPGSAVKNTGGEGPNAMNIENSAAINYNNSMLEGHLKEIRSISEKMMEMEDTIKRCLDGVHEQDSAIHSELHRKEDALNTLRQGVESFNANEMQYRKAISIYEEKTKRMNEIITTQHVNDKTFHDANFAELRAQFDHILSVMQGSPLTMQIFNENVDLKQRLQQGIQTEGPNIVQKIGEMCTTLATLSRAFEQAVKDRKYFIEKIEMLACVRNLSPDKQKLFEEGVENMKTDYNEKIEKLNYEIIEYPPS